MNTCAICLENTDEDCYTVVCCKNNKFHFECLDKWFKIKNTCPLCRSEYSHMEHYTDNSLEYLEKIQNINMGNVVNNVTNIVTTYKYQFEECDSIFLVNFLEKTETFLNIIQEFYDEK